MSDQFLQFLEACNYEIKEGTPHQWQCYGEAAHYVSCEFGNQATAEIAFDRTTREVFEITVWFEDSREDAYRWLNPDTKAAYLAEAEELGVDPSVAWEGVTWADTESFDDIIAKLTAIADDVPFDKRVVIALDLDEDLYFKCLELAHERDITFNQLVEDSLLQLIQRTMPLQASGADYEHDPDGC